MILGHHFSTILGHHPTVATAKIHVGRRLLQRHDGGGGNQTDRHVVKLGNGNVRALRDKQSRSSPGAPGSTCAELTDSPPGTEQGSDDVTECHTFGENFGGPVRSPGSRPSRRVSPRRLHQCTDARKTSPKLPFLPFFGTSGAACRREGSLGNTLQHHEIGHDPCSAGPFQNRVGIGAPKVPHQFPLIVHYLRLLTMAPDPHELALRGRTPFQRPQVACPCVDLTVT